MPRTPGEWTPRDAAKHPKTHRRAPTTKKPLAQNVTSATFDNAVLEEEKQVLRGALVFR